MMKITGSVGRAAQLSISNRPPANTVYLAFLLSELESCLAGRSMCIVEGGLEFVRSLGIFRVGGCYH